MPAKEPGFAERLQTAAKAKQTQLEKMRATKQASDPSLAERQAEKTKTTETRKPRADKPKDAKQVTAKRPATKPITGKPQQTHAAEGDKARKDAEAVARAQAEAKVKQEKVAREVKYPAHKVRRK